MLNSGNNLSRGGASPSNMPPLPQCLPLEPITLGNPKYPRPGELRRVLCVHSTSEDHSFGASHLKAPASVGKVELKHFKESVQDASKKASDRANMLRESMFKLDKYREALSSKKRQRSEPQLVKLGNHSHRSPHDIMTQRLEDRAKSALLNKRVRTSMADQRVDNRSASNSRQQMLADKDGNTVQSGSGSSGRMEEKTRRLLAAGECLDQKIKKKRSVGAVGSRVVNGDRDVRPIKHTKRTADSKLRSCDSHGFRLKSFGVGGINKLDSIFEPTNPDSCTIRKSEHDSSSLSRNRVAVLESGVLVKSSNKPNVQQHISIGSPSSVTKGKVSKAQRTSSVMALDSSASVRPSSGSVQGCEQPTLNKVAVAGMAANHKREASAAAGSPMQHMAQWVGQRPHKNSRSRRTNLVSPVSNHVETQISSQGLATSEFSTRTSSVGTTGSVLLNNVDNDSSKFKIENENVTSLYDFSESEESGAGENKLKHRKINGGEATLTTSHKVGSFLLPMKKNKLTSNESGDGFKKRSGRGSLARAGIPLVKENLKKIPAMEPLQDLVPVSDKNRSKTGRPPSKKLKDRKGIPRLPPTLSNGSSDFTGESDDDHEELYLAANSARSANRLSCSGTFWKKMDYIFAPVSSEDASYLNQQLSVAEELGECLSQMFDDVLGLADEESGNCSRERQDAICGKFDRRRFDKATPLYQRVLSALIEEDESEDFYHHIEGKNTSVQSASDDSHCGSCNQFDIEPKDRDRIESEVESNLGFQTYKNCLLDRLSCDSSAATNGSRNASMSSFLHSNERWHGDDEFSHSDFGPAGEICSNDLGQLQPRESDIPSFPPSVCQYRLMSINEKLLLELQSIGLYPEALPDLAEGEEIITGDIIELKERLHKQVVKKKKNLEKIDKAIQKGRDVERRKTEQVAMDKLIEMAYRKRMACRGSNASKSGMRKVPRQVALAFVKRTLGRCLKFEETGKSCFTDPSLQDVLFSSNPSNNDTKSIDCIGSGTASNTCNEASYQAEVRGRGAVSCASERYDSHSDNLDRGSSGGLQTVNHDSEQASYKQGSTLNTEKKRDVLIDDFVGSASSKVTSAFNCTVLEAKGKRSDRDNPRNNSLAGTGRYSLDSSQTEQKTKVKSKQKNIQSIHTCGGSSQSATNVENGEGEFTLPGNKLKDGAEPTDFGNLHLNELDSMEELGASHDLGGNQDLTSWLTFEEDGLMDHDSIGLEIPMDDLADLNMLM